MTRDAAVVVCDGIECRHEAPARTAGGTPTGWISVSSAEGRRRFCSWDCVISHANERVKDVAGD